MWIFERFRTWPQHSSNKPTSQQRQIETSGRKCVWWDVPLLVGDRAGGWKRFCGSYAAHYSQQLVFPSQLSEGAASYPFYGPRGSICLLLWFLRILTLRHIHFPPTNPTPYIGCLLIETYALDPPRVSTNFPPSHSPCLLQLFSLLEPARQIHFTFYVWRLHSFALKFLSNSCLSFRKRNSETCK